MVAIYKREFKSYMTSMIGYLFIFFILLLTGIYFTAYNLSYGYPKFEYTLSAVTFAFIIGVPILTMRVLAEERKQKTDQLLLTSPISVIDIVLGKYLALVSVFAIAIVIMGFYPIIMSQFGTVSFGEAYTALLGFFLLGCANLAIGVFMSAITESQVIAAVLTFIILFAFYVMSGISTFFSETAMSTCMTFAFLIVAAAIIIYTMIKNAFISVIVGIVGEAVLWIIYLVKASLFEGGIQKILEAFNLSGHFENFTNSLFDITGIVYFLSVIAICLFLTVQSIQKRRWN
jgi:ABC-2 type transport system permease protein